MPSMSLILLPPSDPCFTGCGSEQREQEHSSDSSIGLLLNDSLKRYLSLQKEHESLRYLRYPARLLILG
jgi:hypothetical protein